MNVRSGSWQVVPGEFGAELTRDIQQWLSERGLWWAASVVVHALFLSAALLLLGTVAMAPAIRDDSVTLTAEPIQPVEDEIIPHFETQQPEPPPLDTRVDLSSLLPPSGETLDQSQAAAQAPGEGGPDDGWIEGTNVPEISTVEFERGQSKVLGKGPGPAHHGVPGIFGNRRFGPGGGRNFGVSGATATGDRAVGRALRWLARHQNPDGSWSINGFTARCKSAPCSGLGSIKADGAATALGLLPFLAAGQTHLKTARGEKNAVDYRQNVNMATYWLLAHQKSDGDLSASSEQVMYSHGLATIALAELYALSHDKQVGAGAAGRRLHRTRATSRDRGLALPARRARRHVGGRLANHGPEERANRRTRGPFADDGAGPALVEIDRARSGGPVCL